MRRLKKFSRSFSKRVGYFSAPFCIGGASRKGRRAVRGASLRRRGRRGIFRWKFFRETRGKAGIFLTMGGADGILVMYG